MQTHREIFNAGALPSPQMPCAIFLDIDGTIAPIADSPAGAEIPAATLEVLENLKKITGGAVALISGRSIKDIDVMCKGHHFTAAGQHGLEVRYADGFGEIILNADNYKIIHDINEQISIFHHDYPQFLVEYKGLSIAVHYRGAPLLRDTVRTLMHEIVAPYSQFVKLQEGKMVVEVKLRGADKGMAIKQIMEHSKFAEKTPIFAGDDTTDEDGFRAVNELGGMSIKVGDGATAAGHRVKNVLELQQWLGEIK